MESRKKVLIITYYWPPAGGPGVQRWLKFAKYLPEFGIEPIIYTPENPSFPIEDKTLIKEVSPDLKIIRTKIWEPYGIAEKLNPKTKDYKAGNFEKSEKQSLLTQFALFVRGNFFIPDARKFWIKPSVKYLKNYIEENRIDTIITTGPPHSMHIIGLELKKTHPILKWLADFRDPWVEISYHSELRLTAKGKRKHKDLEFKVLQTADCIIATSFTDASNYKKSGARRVEVITNGFEESDFRIGKFISNKFKITYSGGLEIARNPLAIWEALREWVQEDQKFKNDFELEIYGNLSQDVENSIFENGLKDHLIKKGYVSHKESIQGIKNADLLLLTNFPDEKSKGIIPGKLFEYMATGNPILAIGPVGGDVAQILSETQAGKYFTHVQKEEIKSYIFEVYQKWRSGIEVQQPTSECMRFSRKSLTEKLQRIIVNQ